MHLSFALFTFFLVGLKAATKMNVNIVILWLFDDNRPNLNQRVTDDLIPGLFSRL